MNKHSLELFDIEKYLFTIIPAFDIFLCIFWILVFIFSKKLRKPPGDLFIGIIIGEVFLTFHWLLSAIESPGKIKFIKTIMMII